MKPHERQLSLVAYLHHHRFGRTLEEILADIPAYGAGEAGRKKFQRDRALLAELGLPLRCQEQAGLGDDGNLRYAYLLDRRAVFARPLRLSPAECAGLLALCDTLIDRPGFAFSTWVRSARDKLLAAEARGARDGGPDAPAPRQPLAAPGEEGNLDLVLRALEAGRCLRFHYQGLHHVAPEWREVHPQRLVAWRGAWLLRGWCELRRSSRTFLLRRMQGLELSGRPARADLPVDEGGGPQAWELGLGEGPEAQVALDAAVAPLARRALGALPLVRRLEERPGGGLLAALPVEDPPAFFAWLLGWGRQAALLGPPELQELLDNWLAGAIRERGDQA